MVAFVILALRRGRVAVPGPVRPGGGPGQRHQRQLDPLRGHRPGPVAPLRRAGGPGGHLAHGPGAWPGRSACSAPWSRCGGRSGLQVEAAYGVNVLKYTETVPATSSASLASEIIRGLGYWYFYGSDRVGAWTQSAVAYTQNLWLIGASFVVPVLAFIAAVFSRWRYRGLLRAHHRGGHGAGRRAQPVRRPLRASDRSSRPSWSTPPPDWPCAPPTGPRPWSSSAWPCSSGPGSAPSPPGCAAPGWSSAGSPWPPWPAPPTPLWTGGIIANGFTQPAVPPAYVRQAAAALDHAHPGTRVYALPGNNFAAYRWGDTIDTVYPGPDDPALRHPRAADHGLAGHRRPAPGGRHAAAGRHHGLERARPRWPP